MITFVNPIVFDYKIFSQTDFETSTKLHAGLYFNLKQPPLLSFDYKFYMFSCH